MRVLIVSVFFTIAYAAPSGLYAPAVLVPAIRTVAVPAAIPTISPGDIQAAAIDAQVKANDEAQAAIDNARLLAEQASENANEKAITDASVVNEQNLDAFYSTEDKKWQAVDALKTAEAQIDGAVANQAPALAKSAVSGVLPYVASVGPIAPIVAPISPLVLTPYSHSYSTQTIYHGQELKSEIKEENKEAAVKIAEPEKPAEAEKTETIEKAEITESPALKAAVNLHEKPALLPQSLITPIGFSNVYSYNLGVPAVGQVIAQPLLKYGATVQQVHGVLTPTYLKTVW